MSTAKQQFHAEITEHFNEEIKACELMGDDEMRAMYEAARNHFAGGKLDIETRMQHIMETEGHALVYGVVKKLHLRHTFKQRRVG